MLGSSSWPVDGEKTLWVVSGAKVLPCKLPEDPGSKEAEDGKVVLPKGLAKKGSPKQDCG